MHGRLLFLFMLAAMLVLSQRANAQSFDCGYRSPEEWRAAFAAGVADGRIRDPKIKPIPEVTSQPRPMGLAGPAPTMTCKDIFAYEDTGGLLLTDYTEADFVDLMVDAANAVMVAHGDNFDFIGFFVNFDPFKKFGRAFYFGIENNTLGIGQGLFNDRAFYGIAGNNIEGMVMMWEVTDWATAPANKDRDTQLVLGQEFEHRFAVYLSDLLDGRKMQGDSPCGGEFHWNFKIDGQGSGMSIREWVGEAPAVLDPTLCVGSLCFNTDTGGVWSYTDLYLMGYVSPAEMNAGNSELRYMDDGCSSPYNGPISTFSSADIVAADGARVPNSAAAQKDFRTAWIMIHQPGLPPTDFELKKGVRILNRFSDTWASSSLGLGTMDNTLGLPNQQPVADAGPDQADIECVSPTTTEVILDGTGSSDPDPDCLTYLWTAPGVTFANETSPTPTGEFPLGTTTVTLTVSDGIDEDTDTVDITIVDTIPPEITVELNRDVLWPPNHKMADICATVEVDDICDANPTFVLTSITSDEPDNGKGDGNTVDDIQGADFGTDDVKFQLRSERRGNGGGRKYTLTYTASDDSNNEASAIVCVRVPHDKSAAAMCSMGFSPDGTGFETSFERFALVIPSQQGFDAAELDVQRVYVGNTRGALRPEESAVSDVDGDGRKDLTLFYSIAAAVSLRDASPVGDDINLSAPHGPIGLHYQTSDEKDYLVRDIFRLGLPVSLFPSEPPVLQGKPDDSAPTTTVASIYPNPFNPTTTIAFTLETGAKVSLRIYDVQGAVVRTLRDEILPQGLHEARWDGRDDNGLQVATGVYFVRLVGKDYRVTRKIVLLK